MVSEEMASESKFGKESRGRDEGQEQMEPNDKGVLELERCLEDDLDSLNGLCHWQMEDYKLFQSYNMLGVEGMDAEEDFPPEFREYKEGEARVNESLAPNFEAGKPIEYEEPSIHVMNLGDEESPRNILVGDDWNPVLKATAFKIFMEYKDVFVWSYKDLKGVPLELCVHRIPLVPGAVPVRKRPYKMNKN